jgi:threonine synthase
MKFYSLSTPQHNVSFRKAVIEGLAPDRSLYFPEVIPRLDASHTDKDSHRPFEELAFDALWPFVSPDLSASELSEVLQKTLHFELPLVAVGDYLALELYHGPTLAFKDIGARFMAECLGLFNQKEQKSKKTVVLVATSGDTGGAVASGFLGVENVEVVILYPKGKISDVQELQMTTFHQNIRAIAVDGTFDDCQRWVKQAFVDADLKQQIDLTSANSINVARWLPQMLYYLKAYHQLRESGERRDLVVSVPSGNFGNLCAGLLTQQMGIPFKRFIAATNVNDTVVRYLEGSDYSPKETVPTLSNAMDVSDPSNFIRIETLLGSDTLRKQLKGYRFTDGETLEAIASIDKLHAYCAEPHGAIAYLGLERDQLHIDRELGIFLETAHPIKFAAAVEKALNRPLEEPEVIKALRHKSAQNERLSTYEGLKSVLLSY